MKSSSQIYCCHGKVALSKARRESVDFGEQRVDLPGFGAHVTKVLTLQGSLNMVGSTTVGVKPSAARSPPRGFQDHSTGFGFWSLASTGELTLESRELTYRSLVRMVERSIGCLISSWYPACRFSCYFSWFGFWVLSFGFWVLGVGF